MMSVINLLEWYEGDSEDEFRAVQLGFYHMALIFLISPALKKKQDHVSSGNPLPGETTVQSEILDDGTAVLNLEVISVPPPQRQPMPVE